MKKIIYFCVMMTISLNMMAQIDLNDGVWFPTLDYDFSNPNFAWNSTTWRSMDGVWKAYPHNSVTHGIGKELQIYQVSNCVHVLNNHQMVLTSVYDSTNRIPSHQYQLPLSMNGHFPNTFGDNNLLYYFSGEIDVDAPMLFRYGYFEIRCKLPIHQGAFPAFWLWNADKTNPSDKYYEEIDIFEFSWAFEDTIKSVKSNPNPHGAGNPYCFTTGLYYSDTCSHYHWQNSKARNYPMIADSLSNWHTFACEWMPKYVVWYCDGNIVNEFRDPNSIPRHPLILKTNYAIDKYALEGYVNTGDPEWIGCDSMVIDHIKVYQMSWECDNDEIITCQTNLDSYNHAIKKSVTIAPTQGLVRVDDTERFVFRVIDHFTINGPFQVDSGGELEVILQSCPEND